MLPYQPKFWSAENQPPFFGLVKHSAKRSKGTVGIGRGTREAEGLQAEVNWEVIEIMDRIESDDTARFGKVRTAAGEGTP